MGLPTEKRQPQAGLGKILLYGAPKVGKSTLASTIDVEHTLVLDTEGSTTALEAFVMEIKSWGALTREEPHVLRGDSFRGAIKSLVEDEHDFTTVVVDTVDVLAQLCAAYTLEGLSGGRAGYVHASDFDYGKGWSAITEEFQLRIGALCRAVPNVVLVSHADESTKKDRLGKEITVYRPDVKPKGIREFLEGFVDHVLFAEVVQTDDGETRLLRTQPAETYSAGGRTPLGRPKLPDPLPLEGPALKQALEGLAAPARPAKAAPKAKPKPAKSAPENGQESLGAAA